jgi:hypothetical protein
VTTLSPHPVRLRFVATLSAVAGFVGLELAAMALYPGGTWWDPKARGHRFWQNYLCDLEWRVALNGVPNPVGSRLAQAALLFLVAGLAPFWLDVPSLFGTRQRLSGAAVRGLGLTSVAATIAVVFMPSDRFGVLHGAMVVVACVPGLTAVALAVRGLALGEPRPRWAAWIGGSMLAFAVVDFVLYVSHLIGRSEGTPLVPAMEKAALILLLAWMGVVAFRVQRRTGAGA